MSAPRTKNEKRRIMKYRETPLPPAGDLAANVRWLRDREIIKNLYRRYAYGVDSIDFDLVRSVFHPDCVVEGTLESGGLDEYLVGLEEAMDMWDATLHFVGNQYVEVDGDRGFVESWVVAYHMEAEDSPIDHLVLALRYQDEVVRVGEDWRIIRRKTSKQWHTGPFPRPTIGPPAYPRKSRAHER
jgi:ketosteroid isomerase-like protein